MAGQETQIASLADPALSPLFWRPTRLNTGSAWFGHVPFAHWLVASLRPRFIVELGTHNGVSYAAFCEAVLREKIDARCMAVDTWQGDEHAGFYGEDVYRDLKRFHDQHYAGFSTLFRGTFDAALPAIPDGSIDLLHIDGRHRYDDVAQDFSSWRNKLSPRAVVLFHDTNVRQGDFGVWRLWAELRQVHPHFEFLHGHGLGVLAHGTELAGAVRDLCSLNDPATISTIRERFGLLGDRWIAARDVNELEEQVARLSAELDTARHWGQTAQDKVNELFPAYAEIVEQHRAARAALAEARFEIAKTAWHSSNDSDGLIPGGSHAIAADRAALIKAAQSAREQAMALHEARCAMLTSTTWRVAAGLRGKFRTALPPAPEFPPLPALPEKSLAARRIAAPPAAGRKRALFISGEDHTPGTVYRVERYVETAKSLGYDARWMTVEPVGPDDLRDLHLCVIWRTAYSEHVQGIVDIAREQGALVLYDVDDLMFRPELAIIEIIDGIRSQKFSELHTGAFFRLIRAALQLCDAVLCPTEELAREVRRLDKGVFVVPNGFDAESHAVARRAMREWAELGDDLLRIGYAGGSRTHQRDFAVAAPAIARILRERPDTRLTLFRDPSSGEGVVLMNEFPEFADLAPQIEWRDMVKLRALPAELARFTVNIAPLEIDNPFCEAKSELKYFEAALAGVPTIASPSGPFRRAIIDGETGILATDEKQWYDGLNRLLADKSLRARMAQAAYHDSLAHFGPEARADAFALAVATASGGAEGAAAFERVLYRASRPRTRPPAVPDADIVFQTRGQDNPAVTIIIPVYKYADLVGEALASAAAQTLAPLDLIVIDDASPDDSGDMVLRWMHAHGGRFNRMVLLRHKTNSGLGFARNSGFAAAETDFVLPLDADNRLRPAACETLLSHITESQAAFAYPMIGEFGTKTGVFGTDPYSVLRLQQGNYIDAMALVRKSAWAIAGGYDHVRYGWEDFDFWCRLAERGRFGVQVPEVLADYRVHKQSMLHTTTEVQGHREDLLRDMRVRHPWLDIA